MTHQRNEYAKAFNAYIDKYADNNEYHLSRGWTMTVIPPKEGPMATVPVHEARFTPTHSPFVRSFKPILNSLYVPMYIVY